MVPPLSCLVTLLSIFSCWHQAKCFIWYKIMKLDVTNKHTKNIYKHIQNKNVVVLVQACKPTCSCMMPLLSPLHLTTSCLSYLWISFVLHNQPNNTKALCYEKFMLSGMFFFNHVTFSFFAVWNIRKLSPNVSLCLVHLNMCLTV